MKRYLTTQQKNERTERIVTRIGISIFIGCILGTLIGFWTAVFGSLLQ